MARLGARKFRLVGRAAALPPRRDPDLDGPPDRARHEPEPRRVRAERSPAGARDRRRESCGGARVPSRPPRHRRPMSRRFTRSMRSVASNGQVLAKERKPPNSGDAARRHAWGAPRSPPGPRRRHPVNQDGVGACSSSPRACSSMRRPAKNNFHPRIGGSSCASCERGRAAAKPQRPAPPFRRDAGGDRAGPTLAYPRNVASRRAVFAGRPCRGTLRRGAFKDPQLQPDRHRRAPLRGRGRRVAALRFSGRSSSGSRERR